MTINVALVTSGAVVLGCDSVASVTQSVLEPWSRIDRTPDGMPRADDNGQLTAKFDWADVKSVVTQVYGGVTKIFELCCNSSARVAATTAGIAALNGRTMESLAAEFCQQANGEAGPKTVEEVAQQFLLFARQQYDAHYGPEYPDFLQDELEFLVAGYGLDDHFGRIFRLNVRANTSAAVYEPGVYGVAWAGQADGVTRLVFGYDSLLQRKAHRVAVDTIEGMYEAFSGATALIVQNILGKLNVAMPEGVDTTLPEKPEMLFPWQEFQLDIECQNLPLQDAIDLVSYLVYVQAGRAKFVKGVPTVGGRIRVGYMTRALPFRLINEPEIVHRITGFPAQL